MHTNTNKEKMNVAKEQSKGITTNLKSNKLTDSKKSLLTRNCKYIINFSE